MKKLISLFLTLAMVLSLASVAMAANTSNGTIKIKGVAVYQPEGSTEYATVANYAVYKMLTLASYDEDEELYSYIVENDAWKTFLTTDEEAVKYFNVDSNDTVTWKKNTGTEPSAAAAIIAPRALAYAKDHGIPETSMAYTMGTPSNITDGNGEVIGATADITFSGLELGYYLVESSMGVLCGLTTTTPDAEIVAKNVPPVIDKKVQEDSLAESGTSSWGATNTADIGQSVDFDITLDVRSGAENYVVHDNMSAGLTFKPDTVVVKLVSNGSTSNVDRQVTTTDPATGTTTTTTNYYVHYKASSTANCICGQNADDCIFKDSTCTFEVELTDEFCSTLKTNDRVVILYSATLNEKAVIAGAGNPNEAWISFGEKHHVTEKDTTTTYTYSFDLVKVDGNRNLLDGAEFKLYNTSTSTDPIALVLTNPLNEGQTPDEDYVPEYRIDSTSSNYTIVVTGGHVKIIGIDKGTYYLEETVAPDGYNKLTERHEFSITNANLEATFDSDGKVSSTSSAVKVQNNAGAILPETGAMGTTLFIVFGAIVVLGTGVVLVAKKRMSMIED